MKFREMKVQNAQIFGAGKDKLVTLQKGVPMSKPNGKESNLVKQYLSEEKVAKALSILTPSERTVVISAFVKALLEQKNTLRADLTVAIKTCHVRIEQVPNNDLEYIEKKRVLEIINSV